jgi:excisionase family DNA binding protein
VSTAERKPLRRHIDRSIMTTGDVAALFRVAPRTIAKWFDKGHLKGWRIPGSQDRRFRRADVLSFGIEHGMLLPERDVCVTVGFIESHLKTLKYHLGSKIVLRDEYLIASVVEQIKMGAFAVVLDTGMGTDKATTWLDAIPKVGRHHVLCFGACNVPEMPGVEQLGRASLDAVAARIAALAPAR